jgi:hypothetical protein
MGFRSGGGLPRRLAHCRQNPQNKEAMMAHKKLDGVIEAVHYGENGQLEWVRAYKKRGPVFSDIMILDRTSLVTLLKAGKQLYTGKRIPYMGSNFEVLLPVRLVDRGGKEILTTGDRSHESDCLEDVPII